MELKDLIKEGEALETQKEDTGYGTFFFEGVDFETWVAKTIFYLEENKPKSSLTQKAIKKNVEINQSNNYEHYLFLIGVLKAIE